VIAVQTQEYANRLIALGAPPNRVQVTGSIKFDGVSIDGVSGQTQVLRDAFGIAQDQRVFVAGSTHDPEEQIALDTWQQLRDEFPDLRLVLVPRHRERFDEVATLLESRGLDVRRRSATATAGESDDSTASTVCLL